jgi:predicted RNA-binding Zn-ribbon protein involved in translation (DUF1610 family)
MPARASKRTVASVLTLLIVLFGLTLSGCHSEHGARMAGTGEACPACKTQTHVVPVADLTYTICICPACKRVIALDDATRAKVEAYTGGDIGETVHVCDECDAVIERCAVCRAK